MVVVNTYSEYCFKVDKSFKFQLMKDSWLDWRIKSSLAREIKLYIDGRIVRVKDIEFVKELTVTIDTGCF